MKGKVSERPKKVEKESGRNKKRKRPVHLNVSKHCFDLLRMLLCEHTPNEQHFEKMSFSMSQKAWILFAGIMARRVHPWLLIAVSLEKQE